MTFAPAGLLGKSDCKERDPVAGDSCSCDAPDRRRSGRRERCSRRRSDVHLVPANTLWASSPVPATLVRHGWRHYCRGLFQIPVAA